MEIEDLLNPEEQGEFAWEEGLDADTNPFPKGHPARRQWFVGYYRARTNATVERVRRRLDLDAQE
jgi:hypothetical protein